jgi:hypothetical protein
MKTLSRTLLGVCLAVSSSLIAMAQENPQGEMSVPQVLQITREFTKPGKSGTVHEKTESAFVQAMTRAKWPTHYLAMTSLSGKSCALFLTHYASFEAWEKDNQATEKNTALFHALESADEADGELLESVDQSVYVFREDLSLRTMVDIAHMRYLEAFVIHVRPGYTREWTELAKMVKEADAKALPDAHWGMYQQVFGGEGATYLVLEARKTLAEVDRRSQEQAQFEAALGEEGMRKLGELDREVIASSSHQLFAFNPRMSYVPEEWIKADPDFWKPKPAMAPPAKLATEEKKAKP